ncbi:lytic transglycosylase domain-containing protein [Acetobacter sp. AN02]|uniref:lytic transglycosylase domain-containing protein n=1 Tax=Acetobacter sp. AN02 TaxID=2894186 RepID=UPI002434594C|nr:lytic transglycosylase domain-containing protein [Acetobacter sp. AN02]MDG6094699.1 lytic transglycosylase domain-containing protein [Acetobacter sp. AN02]
MFRSEKAYYPVLAAGLAALLTGCAAPPVSSRAEMEGDSTAVTETGPMVVTTSSSATVAARLAVWQQLVAPDSRTAGIPVQTYADFLNSGPAWPLQKLISTRMQKKLAAEQDDAVVRQICAAYPVSAAAALVRCLDAAGMSAQLQSRAREAWRNGADSLSDAGLLSSRFGSVLSDADSRARFDRLESRGRLEAAAATLPFLSTENQKLAQARLAFHRGDAAAEALQAALSSDQRSDPGLVLDHLRWLRKAGRNEEALALWQQSGFTAEAAAPASGFKTERAILARSFLETGQAGSARLLADDTVVTGRQRTESLALTGWLSLRKLNDPQAALRPFRELARSDSLEARSRGLYWLGRAQDAGGDRAGAQASWSEARQHPETFYGQMAIAALSGDQDVFRDPSRLEARTAELFRALPEPEPDPAQLARLSGNDLVQAGQMLAAQGDRKHAGMFFALLLTRCRQVPEYVAAARLAMQAGLPDQAVMASRLAGGKGVVMPRSGWPRPWTPPAMSLPAGLVLGLMRQESNFNPDAVSPSNAIGLMQLLPGTGREMGRRLHLRADISSLYDPQINMTLGTAYLEQVLTKFNGSVVYAAAGYNAGPHRTDQWLGLYGDPWGSGADQAAMLDWIESIPKDETRGYVQRVWEGMILYAPAEGGPQAG